MCNICVYIYIYIHWHLPSIYHMFEESLYSIWRFSQVPPHEFCTELADLELQALNWLECDVFRLVCSHDFQDFGCEVILWRQEDVLYNKKRWETQWFSEFTQLVFEHTCVKTTRTTWFMVDQSCLLTIDDWWSGDEQWVSVAKPPIN